MMDIRAFRIEDYSQAYRLWETTDGVGLSDADSHANIARFLGRNPDLSFVAADGTSIVGTVLCGHDGRRGLIHHLVVGVEHRRQGLGRALVAASLQALRNVGIQKCHLLVFNDNLTGREFWKRIGAEERVTLATFSLVTDQVV